MRAIPFLFVLLPLTTASVTSGFGVSVGGSKADSAACTAASSVSGYVFLGGSVSGAVAVSSSLTAASAATTVTSQVHSATAAANSIVTSGFIEAIDATNGGARLWYAEIVGSGSVSVTAMTVGNPGSSANGDVLYLCGTFNSSDTTYTSPAGVTSSVFVSDVASPHTPTVNPMSQDVFTLALNANTGALLWSGSMHSLLDDFCYAVTYTSFGGGNVVFGGSAGGTYLAVDLQPPFPAAPWQNQINLIVEPSGVEMHDPASGDSEPTGYWLRLNSAGGSAAIAPTLNIEGIPSQFGDWVTALAFNAYGVLYIGFNAYGDVQDGYVGNPQFLQPANRQINTVKPFVMFVSSNAFASDAAAQALIAPIWSKAQNISATSIFTLFPPILGISAFGAAYGNDVITGLEVLQSNDAGNTVLAISGWTNGTVGGTFNASNYNFPNPYDLNPAHQSKYQYPLNYLTVKPSGLLPNVFSAWLIVTNAYMNSSSATLTFLNPNAGVQAMSSGMALDSSGALYVSLTLSGSGSIAGQSFTAAGASDVALMRLNSAGVVQSLTLAGNSGVGADVTSGVTLATVSGQTEVFVSGTFSNTLPLGATTSCPVTLTSAGMTDAFLAAFSSSACPVPAASSSTAMAAGNSSTAGGSAEVSQSSTAFGAAARATGSSTALVALASVAAAVAIALGAANREL